MKCGGGTKGTLRGGGGGGGRWRREGAERERRKNEFNNWGGLEFPYLRRDRRKRDTTLRTHARVAVCVR